MRAQILDVIGVQQWLPKHHASSLLVSDNPLFCAACLVLLPENPTKNSEVKKILTGMLSVLCLKADELCIAWVNGSLMPEKKHMIGQEVAKWSPYSVLILGESFAAELLDTDSSLKGSNAWVQVTYHPEVLLASKELKNKAYRDLLCLRDQISRARAA